LIPAVTTKAVSLEEMTRQGQQQLEGVGRLRSGHQQLGRDDDLEACVTLWLEAVAARDGAEPPYGSAERVRTKFTHPLVSWRIITAEDGALLGFGLMTVPGTGYPSDPPDAAYLSLLGVHPAAQGDGVGSLLLETLVDDARTAGYESAALHVLADNAVAMALYRTRGWSPIGAPLAHGLTGAPIQTYLKSPLAHNL
jgi:ribosomal protein S18 acetylase RimI-like enzyme